MAGFGKARTRPQQVLAVLQPAGASHIAMWQYLHHHIRTARQLDRSHGSINTTCKARISASGQFACSSGCKGVQISFAYLQSSSLICNGTMLAAADTVPCSPPGQDRRLHPAGTVHSSTVKMGLLSSLGCHLSGLWRLVTGCCNESTCAGTGTDAEDCVHQARDMKDSQAAKPQCCRCVDVRHMCRKPYCVCSSALHLKAYLVLQHSVGLNCQLPGVHHTALCSMDPVSSTAALIAITGYKWRGHMDWNTTEIRSDLHWQFGCHGGVI